VPDKFSGGMVLGRTRPPVVSYRVTSLIRKRTPLGPYRRPVPRALWWSWGGWRFLMSEVPLYTLHILEASSHLSWFLATYKMCRGSDGDCDYRGTSLIRNSPLPKNFHRALGKVLR